MRAAISVVAALFILSLHSPVSAQAPEELRANSEVADLNGFLLKGGVTNLIQGDVIHVVDGVAKRRLRTKEQLANGSMVQVGNSGRAEILLNPGYYLRLSSNTEATLLDLSRENLKLKLSHGSAILEVPELSNSSNLAYGTGIVSDYLPGIYPPITIVTPQGELATTRGGIYRIDVGGDGTDLKVFRGLAVVDGTRIKDGMRALVRNGRAVPTNFDKSADAFDNWSRERAALLVKANKSVRNTAWHTHLRKNRFSFLNIEDDDWRQQARERHTVSAREGMASFVEEGVAFKSGDSDWKPLTEGIGLVYGDRVRTSADSRAEILPYPTCFLYLSSNTEIVYAEGPNGGPAVSVVRGSAIIIVELNRADRGLISLIAPRASYEIVRSGVYRLNVLSGGSSEMIVRSGRVNAGGREIKEGKKEVPETTGLTISSVKKETQDSFDLWSKRRSSVRLDGYRPYGRSRRAVVFASSVASQGFLADSLRYRAAWGGLWFYERALGAYTFIPGRWEFRSPYGGKYSVRLQNR